MENWIRIRTTILVVKFLFHRPFPLYYRLRNGLLYCVTRRLLYSTLISIFNQEIGDPSQNIHIYIYIHIKPILLPSSFRTSSLGGSRVSRLGYAPNKKGSQWWCPKGGVPREIKISFGRNDSVVTKYAAYARVSNFCLRYSMFRCRKGGADPTPRKEGAGNPSKSAGHMLEEREIRVLYYSRAARDTTLPPDF